MSWYDKKIISEEIKYYEKANIAKTISLTLTIYCYNIVSSKTICGIISPQLKLV